MSLKGNPVRLTVDFLAETMEARRQWDDILKVLKKYPKQTINQNPASKMKVKYFFR